MRSEETKSKEWTEKEREAARRVARLQAAGDSGIDFEEIPRSRTIRANC